MHLGYCHRKIFLFCTLSCRFKTRVIRGLHCFTFFAALSNVCLLSFPCITVSKSTDKKLVNFINHCLPCPCCPQYILLVSNSLGLLFALCLQGIAVRSFWFYVWFSFLFPFCYKSFLLLKSSVFSTTSLLRQVSSSSRESVVFFCFLGFYIFHSRLVGIFCNFHVLWISISHFLYC